MVLPSAQRGGHGKFLIDFSYALSLKEGKPGSPEKPLSDLGHKTYVSYWTHIVLSCLLKMKSSQLSIKQIEDATAIAAPDIVYVLENYKILRCENSKYVFCLDENLIKGILTKSRPPERLVQKEKIHWIPQIAPKFI